MNKRGTRRLDCAFEPDERKYYISEESVKDVIREERNKGRQSEMFNPDLSDVEDVSDESDRHDTENGGQRRTVSDESVGHKQNMADNVRQEEPTPKVEQDTNYVEQQSNEHTTLQIQVATLEEQAKTKDEMMTFLRKEIDRRGDHITQDRETYEKSLEWFRSQVEAKDAVIGRLNTEMRGLLEAPKAQERVVESKPERVTEEPEVVQDERDESTRTQEYRREKDE
jgi:hypothetical protein